MTRLEVASDILVVGNVVLIAFNLWLNYRLRKLREFYVQMIADIRRHYEGED